MHRESPPQDAEHPARSFEGLGAFSKAPKVFAPLLVLPSFFMHREIENTAPPKDAEHPAKKFWGVGAFSKVPAAFAAGLFGPAPSKAAEFFLPDAQRFWIQTLG